MAQQTAVEWLIEQIKKDSNIRLRGLNLDELEEQAKQMEKEQLENARPQIISSCIIKEISDEEIEKAAENYAWTIKTNTFSDPVKANELAESSIQDFKAAIEWYREQLKKKQ